MCVAVKLGSEEVSVGNTFQANQRLLIQRDNNSLDADEIDSNVIWDGWINKEDCYKWTRKAWRHAELFATKFNQNGRWYDVPPGQIINVIAFSNNETTIIKVITREAVGLELKVFSRFALTGKRKLIPV